MGADIDGEAAGDESGISVALSADGPTLAVGAFYNHGGGDPNAVEYSRGTQPTAHAWYPCMLGTPPRATGSRSAATSTATLPTTVSQLSDPRSRCQPTAPSSRSEYSATAMPAACRCTSWIPIPIPIPIPMGADIDGEAFGGNSGVSISLSADGTILAIGALFNDGPGADRSIRHW